MSEKYSLKTLAMFKAQLPNIFRLIILVMLLNATLSIGRSVSKTYGPTGGIDLHSYWYYGHFVRQGRDPYQAYFNKAKPAVPIKYLDGVVQETLPVKQPGLAATPANAAPTVIVLSALSLFSWPTAKTLWLFVNLVFMFTVPWLTMQLLPTGVFKWQHILLVCLAFYGFQATRVATWVGQTTLFTLMLMMGSLFLMKKSWLVSGLMLGLALSKISLALPIFLFMLFERKYRVIGVSLIVQLLGVLSISMLEQTPLISIVEGYFRIWFRHTSFPGIHLATILPDQSNISNVVILIGSLVMFGLVWKWYPVTYSMKSQDSKISFPKFHILTILMLWTLLVGYHRVYDATMAIVFVILIIYGVLKPEIWNLSGKTFVAVIIFLSSFLIIMSFPGQIVGAILPQSYVSTWLQIVSSTMTLSLVCALAISLWLLGRIHDIAHGG